ncbi:hypothetical protein I8752_08065 [Nostocaceae cyanobacterium CENA369]|uniref:Plasmid stabilization system n=1 Tax=Dendronalium phyllosphericum CENA369 TaxID=1725256 RepID=A0A8J7LEN7_9NOST|nr:hypothetical protein [Dendronalium phyllosphericum CENA369]
MSACREVSILYYHIGRIAGTRELVITRTPFIVAYRVRADQIEILAVIHATRRWYDNF